MSRAKREKKSKMKTWIPIICIIVVGVTFYMIYDLQHRIEKMDIQNTTNSNEKVIENELVNEIVENIVEENTVENEVANTVENTTINTAKNTTAENKTNTDQTSVSTQPGVTDKKQKAIELVKRKWGEDDTVSYVFDYVNENGEYVIAVKDKTSATVKYYFRVNLETETVELD